MSNIFIEGISGTGKSTLLTILENKLNYRGYREGDLSPVDLFRCCYVTTKEYNTILNKYSMLQSEIEKNTLCENEMKVISYLKIITDIKGFHKDLEQYEIYNGNVPFEKFQKVILHRFKNFNYTNNIFECSFFQNILTTIILFYDLETDEILNFYKEIIETVANKNFKLIYIKSENIEQTILNIKVERDEIYNSNIWYDLLINFVKNSPFAIHYNDTVDDFNLLIKFLEKRVYIENIVISFLKENVYVVEEKNYNIENIEKWCISN